MADAPPPPTSRSRYRTLIHQSRLWHTYLSMLAVILFFFFGVTGFMLNHPEWFGLNETHSRDIKTTVPHGILDQQDKLMLVEFLRGQGASGAVKNFDWPEEGEAFHVLFKSPRGNVDADITLPEGTVTITIQSRRVAGILAKLHTGQEAGIAWRWISDLSAVLLVFSSLTGMILWQSLPKRRVLGAVAFVVSLVAVGVVYWACVP